MGGTRTDTGRDAQGLPAAAATGGLSTTEVDSRALQGQDDGTHMGMDARPGATARDTPRVHGGSPNDTP